MLPQTPVNQISLHEARHDLGCLYLRWNRPGDLDRATEQIEAAYNARLQWIKANHSAPNATKEYVQRGLIDSEYRLAQIELQRNDLDNAKNYVDSQFKRLKLVNKPSLASKYNAHYQHAIVDWQSNKQNQAITHLKAAINLSGQMRQKVGHTPFERSLAQTQMLTASQRLMEFLTELQKPDEVFFAMETARGQGLSEDLTMDRAALRKRIDREFVPARARIKFDLDPIIRKGRNEQLERQWAELNLVYRAYREARAEVTHAENPPNGVNPPDAKHVLENLKNWSTQNDALVLEYSICPDKSFLVTITPDQATRSYDLQLSPNQQSAWGLMKSDKNAPLTAGMLDELWTSETGEGIGDIFGLEHNEAVTPERRVLTKDLTSRLADLLLPGEVQQLLKATRYKRVLVIPDGRLAMLPFDALRISHTDGSTIPLIELDIPFTYAPSAGVFLTLVERSKNKIDAANGEKPVLLVSKKVFNDHNQALWPRLGEVAQQTADAKTAFQDLLEHANDIGEAACHQLLHQKHRQFISFATHGLAFNEFENVFGSIKLKVVNKKDQLDNGQLETLDVFCMDLTGCQMVMLTVCQTNVGPTVSGEIPLGFTRSFLAAGASRVVSSNWDVDDRSAAKNADNFYNSVASELKTNGNNFASVDYAMALHKARRTRFESFDAPQDWAPLVHIGP